MRKRCSPSRKMLFDGEIEFRARAKWSARVFAITPRSSMIALAKARMTASGVRRAKAALSSGCKPHPAIAPAGSNRSSHGGNEVAEAFD
jgi:hypothetical protein